MPSPRELLPVTLTSPVGNDQSSDKAAIRWAKHAFQQLGRYPQTENVTGYIDRRLADPIQNYQRDRGLKHDGKLLPDGETEQTLKVELSYLLEG